MKKSILAIFTILLSLASQALLFSSEITIELGRKDRWKDLFFQENLIFEKGKWGDLDILLKDNEYESNNTSDCLIHFNQKNASDVTGNYSLSGNAQLSTSQKILGTAAYLFEESRNTITLKPLKKNALFQAGQIWGDFSIEFWINPLTLGDGEAILNWEGARIDNNRVVSQNIKCYIQNRKLHFDFHNIFVPPDAGDFKIELNGLDALIPEKWYHHLVRFKSDSGLLEYLVNGIPEDVKYATLNGKENSTICIPRTGTAYPGSIILGEKYSGFMDEFQILSRYNDSPKLKKYSSHRGEIMTKPFNLEYSGSWIYAILADENTPQDSKIFYYYRIANHLSGWNNLDNPWIEFSPGEFKNKVTAKYIQLRAILEPSGNLEHSPVLSFMGIIYEPDYPPPPPIEITAEPGNSSITLFWNPVFYQDIAGYLVYYGEAPGYYICQDSILGPSPIDAGLQTRFTVTGLQNGKLYYFSIVAYDSAEEPHKSVFSKEISARPSSLIHE
ncbi:MAG: fibronectin type III domain-containing protein [Spirochaetales bacterium]|nr:fibronectin type III domain-containing protein [Spirochaetales bacterium]